MKRSWLFLPADNARFAANALAGDADVVVFDLEDAVVEERKALARGRAAAWTQDPANKNRGLFVRINGLPTQHALRDVMAVVGPSLDGILLPKVGSAADVQVIDWLLTQAERDAGLELGAVGLVALIETAAGVVHLHDIVHAGPRLVSLGYGSVDLAADTGMSEEETGRRDLGVRVPLVMHSKEAGLQPPIDSVTVAIDDLPGLSGEAERARSLGFQGKFCIHPTQVDTVNAAFTPNGATVDWARRVLDGIGRSGTVGAGAFRLDGELVDAATAVSARSVLERAGVLAERSDLTEGRAES